MSAATVTLGNGPQASDGSYINCQNVANNLVFTSIVIQADSSITIADNCDLSTSIYGIPAFDLSLIAPTINLDKNLNRNSYGRLFLTANTLNLSDRITAGGTLVDPARVFGGELLTQVNVLGNAASIQQAISISSPTSPVTVQVGAGQYNENLTIAKALTLSGNDGTAPAGADPTAPEIFGTQAGGQVITVTAANVTIDGLHLNGAVAGGSLTASVNGIYANGVSNLNVSHNTLEGFSGPSIVTPGSTNVTLNANLIPHTVSFDANGGSGSMVDETHNAAAALTANSFTRSGYSFTGWNTASNGSGTSYADGASYPFDADLTLYAQWLADSHTVSFDSNGGSGSMVDETHNAAAALTANSFTRSGYSFTGWNTASNGSGTSYADGASYPFDADLTLYAQWLADSHTVSFDSNGGSGSMVDETHNAAAALTANSFTRSGYSFTGWNTASNGSGTSYADGASYPFDADLTLYAQWLADSHTVSFDSNGGSGSMVDETHNAAAALTANSFTRSGYSFTGWNTASNGSGTSYADGASYPFDADLTLYAQWLADSHTVSFDSNGGSGSMVDETHNAAAALTANSFTRSGYSFTGWNTASNGSGTSYADGASYPFDADLTLYAQWLADSHTVSFDSNGGSGSMVDETHNAAAALTANSFTRSGYSFTGWNTASNGSGTSYADGASYPFDADLTLYAQWLADSHTVSFDSNGGSGSMVDETHNAAAALTANSFTRSGYSFTGWNTASNGSGTSYADGASYPFDADLTLYAQWLADSHTVSFDSNGGSGSMVDETHNAAAALTANSFTRSGYSFTGWNTASNGSGTSYADGASYPFDADLTLYAQWLADSHTVSFDSNGGSGSMVDETHNAAAALTANSFTRSGYSFTGWNTASNGSGTSYADGASYPFDADLTLYAQWLADSHTVSFDSNGGSGSMVDETHNAAAALTANSFTRSGYSFAGWNTQAGGGGTSYADGASYPFDADLTLYAQWTEVTSTPPAAPEITSENTVTFTVGTAGSFVVTTTGFPIPSLTNTAWKEVKGPQGYKGCDPSTLPPQVTFIDNGDGTATIASTAAPIRDGHYTLCLNASNGVGSAAKQKFTLKVTAPPKPKPKPTPKPKTVSFDANGGTGSMTQEVESTPTALTANSFTRSGYSFAGWNTQAGGGGTSYADGASYPFDADLTLYAQWLADSHTVSFDSNGGSGSMVDETHNAPAALTANSFTRSGYSFAGWNTQAGGGGTSYADGASYPFDADLTLYAQWTEVTSTPPAAPEITSENTVTFTVGTAGSFVVTTTGFPIPSLTNTAWKEVKGPQGYKGCDPSTLPPQVTFIDNGDGTATIASTAAPIRDGHYTLCLNASNGVGSAAKQKFTLKVTAPPKPKPRR